MNRRRSGRIDLAWLLAAGFGGGLLVVVLLYRLPEREASQPATLRPGSSESNSLADAIQALDQRLARIEAALATQGSRGEREPVNTPTAIDAHAAPVSGSPADLDEVHNDMLQMSKRIDLLAASIKENHKPTFSMPTLEQIHAARRDIDWAYIDQVRLLALSDPNAATERARSMTFDDLLKKVGLPNVISEENGQWSYFRMQVDETGGLRQRGITYSFVGDSVSLVSGY